MSRIGPFRTRELQQVVALTLLLWVFDVALFFAPGIVGGVYSGAWATTRILLIGVVGTALTSLVYAAVRAVRAWRSAPRYLAVILAAIVCGGLLSAIDLAAQEPLRRILAAEASPLTPQQLVVHGLTNWIGLSWIFGLAGVIFLLIQSNKVVSARERDLAAAHAAAMEAQNMATAARLAALRYQLNPHFLFNTLNAVSSAVVNHRIEEAENMLSRLADFLRVTLAADPQAMIPLEDELETLQAYLAIEGERFRDRLGVRFICPDRLLQALVPSFLLQPLVENSIKHGVSRTTRTVTLRVEAMQDGDDLVVIVEDDGGGRATGRPAERAAPGSGVGLENVRQRLEVLYGARGVLQATPREGGYLAMIRLPLTLQSDPAMAA
ncbi:MAG: signal transduction histidine kinase LytS [Phenylobacterium zucineum]|nr:MAG: signal transduction histidine kinase LytS [Phenylobacterium zucineum]